jgi:hypothetical protein
MELPLPDPNSVRVFPYAEHVVISNESETRHKEHEGQWSCGIFKEELTDHPNAIGRNPTAHGQIV